MKRVAQVEYFARAGYAARAVVYFLLGYLTLATSRTEGTSSVLEDIQALPAGTVVLVLTGIGLAGYGVFRLYGAAIDIQGNGTDVKGAGKRIGHALSGCAHLLLCYLAMRIAFSDGGSGSGSGGGGGSGGAEAASTVMRYPGGAALVVLVGVGFGFAALDQFRKAVTAKFMGLLDADAPNGVEWLGRIGYAARGVVFTALAWQIAQAGLGGGTGGIGFEGAFASLRQLGWLYTAVAFGLLVFGIFSAAMARWRRIRNDDVLQRLRAQAARV